MVGKTISHYKILEKLGEGGMGVVYKAFDTKLQRHVAIKFLPAGLAADPMAKERFVREALAVSALEHTNICNIHEIDETGEGQTFIVIACYEGEMLKEKIERGPLKLEEVVDVETRARAPEVAQARTLPDQLQEYWKATGFEPRERREPLLSRLAELEVSHV